MLAGQKGKAIVTPAWLLDSAAQGKPLPCGDYAALHDLYEETVQNCPYSNCHCTGSGSDSPRPSRAIAAPSSNTNIDKEIDLSSLSLKYNSRYSCCRASPLVCTNQGLVTALDVMRQSRSLEGEDRSALSYERAVAVSHSELYALDVDALANNPFRSSKVGSLSLLPS